MSPNQAERPCACFYRKCLKTNDEGMTLMKMNSRYGTWALAIAMGMGIGGATVQAVAAPFFQDQGPDYSKNKRYQQGMQDGQYDHAHKLDHSKKRNIKKDEDQKAYEAGYQKGHGN